MLVGFRVQGFERGECRVQGCRVQDLGPSVGFGA